MAVYRILIVDNQRKLRRDLRTGIESLGADFKVTDATSGEEALLLISHQPVQLLVSEFRLAGMTGLELMQKVRQSQPGVKTIFISEAGQASTGKQAGVDAILSKPVDMPGFLKAVERCLGLGLAEREPKPEIKTDASAAVQRPSDAVQRPSEAVPRSTDAVLHPSDAVLSLSDTLEEIRQRLGAIAVLLMDREGHAAVQAGDLPADMKDASLQAALKATFDAGVKVSWALGRLPPQDLSYYAGVKFDLYVAHVGQSTVLVALTVPAQSAERRGRIILTLPVAVNALLRGFSTRDRLPDAPSGLTPARSGPDSLPADSPPDLDLELLLSQTANPTLQAADLDSYWAAAAEQAAREGMPKPGALSYEQARKLGLAPKEEPQG